MCCLLGLIKWLCLVDYHTHLMSNITIKDFQMTECLEATDIFQSLRNGGVDVVSWLCSRTFATEAFSSNTNFS